MLDFTSALYLGFRHPSASLRPWTWLTTGVPDALAARPDADAVARRLAALQGCPAAVLAPSTLHLFFDLFGLLGMGDTAIYFDTHTYPIVRWAVERAAGRGVPVHAFPAHEPSVLRRLVRRDGRPPIIVADGVCPACGRPTPLPAYAAVAAGHGGWAVLDDTQGLGILGAGPSHDAPLGSGGGGSLRWHGSEGADNVVLGASLAKAFGVPLAVLAGPRELVERFAATADTRVHCSPPATPAIRAAERALELNRRRGDPARGRLLKRVRQFRRRVGELGLEASGGLFPLQAVAAPDGDAAALHARLLAGGVRAVPQRTALGAHVTFVLNSRHSPADINRAADALARAISARPDHRAGGATR